MLDGLSTAPAARSSSRASAPARRHPLRCSAARRRAADRPRARPTRCARRTPETGSTSRSLRAGTSPARTGRWTTSSASRTASDATVNDVVLAVASGGVRRFLRTAQSQTPVKLKAMVPVSVRDRDGAGELGNQISFIFVDLPCDEPDPLARLADVEEAMSERKHGGEPEGADQRAHSVRLRAAPASSGRLTPGGEPARLQPRGLEHPRPARAALHARLRARGGPTRSCRSPTTTRCRSA